MNHLRYVDRILIYKDFHLALLFAARYIIREMNPMDSAKANPLNIFLKFDSFINE